MKNAAIIGLCALVLLLAAVAMRRGAPAKKEPPPPKPAVAARLEAVRAAAADPEAPLPPDTSTLEREIRELRADMQALRFALMRAPAASVATVAAAPAAEAPLNGHVAHVMAIRRYEATVEALGTGSDLMSPAERRDAKLELAVSLLGIADAADFAAAAIKAGRALREIYGQEIEQEAGEAKVKEILAPLDRFFSETDVRHRWFRANLENWVYDLVGNRRVGIGGRGGPHDLEE